MKLNNLYICLTVFLSIATTSCANRGLNIAEQIPSEFMKQYESSGINSDDTTILGFVLEGEQVKEENIIFVNNEQRQKYENYKSNSTATAMLTSPEGVVHGKIKLQDFNESADRVANVKEFSKKGIGFIVNSIAAEKDKSQNSESRGLASSTVDESQAVFEPSGETYNLTIDNNRHGVVFRSLRPAY